jgi:hypothetical protein
VFVTFRGGKRRLSQVVVWRLKHFYILPASEIVVVIEAVIEYQRRFLVCPQPSAVIVSPISGFPFL